MVDPTVVGVSTIFIFILILIVIFAFSGHLTGNPYTIFEILIITVVLLSAFFVIAYFREWTPYRSTNINNPNADSNRRYNNILLSISVGILVLFSVIFVIVLFLGIRHHKQKPMYYHELPTEQDMSEQKTQVQDIKEAELRSEESMGKTPEEGLEQSEESIGKTPEEGLEQSEIERLALENELQESSADLEKGSDVRVIARDELLKKELEEKDIRQDVVEEGEKRAELKELEASRAVRTLLPSVTMFGPEGSDQLIEGIE